MSDETLKPGVVTGEGYNTLINAAKSGGYAFPAVNVTGTNAINAVMEAAANANSDIIIQLSNSGAQFYAGRGIEDGFKAKVMGAVAAAQHAHLLAEHYGICVVMHTDHANKALIPWIEAMLDEGEQYYEKHGKPLYSSHMLDLSADPIDFNLGECARILERMAKLDMSLEIELGVTGGEEDGIGSDFEEGADNSKLYTQPEDVLQAYDLLNPIGYGVFKMNIDTDTQFAFSEPVGRFVNENPKAFQYQVDPEDGTPYKKFYDPRKYLRLGEEGIIARLQEACEDLGSKGRSIASC